MARGNKEFSYERNTIMVIDDELWMITDAKRTYDSFLTNWLSLISLTNPTQKKNLKIKSIQSAFRKTYPSTKKEMTFVCQIDEDYVALMDNNGKEVTARMPKNSPVPPEGDVVYVYVVEGFDPILVSNIQ
jgi:hypothetical protein